MFISAWWPGMFSLVALHFQAFYRCFKYLQTPKCRKSRQILIFVLVKFLAKITKAFLCTGRKRRKLTLALFTLKDFNKLSLSYYWWYILNANGQRKAVDFPVKMVAAHQSIFIVQAGKDER